MNSHRLFGVVERIWETEILPVLMEYIRIPSKSPMFDARWQENGYIEQAVVLLSAWARRALPQVTLEVVRLPGRTPLLLLEVESTAGPDSGTVLLYGHLDKQPEMGGWREGRGPWVPVLDGDRLYGRGAGDDGYAMFAALAAILALREQAVPHARCVILIEACEESGSYDLPHYVNHLAARIGTPSLVVCLDSGCGNYEQLWLTTSLRGVLVMDLTVQVLEEGVHSGTASGIVPSSFRLLRQLLSRLEDERTGAIVPAELHVPIPPERVEQAVRAVAALGVSIIHEFPWTPGVRPASNSPSTALLNRTWRPALSIIGMDGVPPPASAGNVLRPLTTATLSLRLPPTLDPQMALATVRGLLESEPPCGARVSLESRKLAPGWSAAPLPGWLEEAVESASVDFFGAPAGYWGGGGSIAFAGMLGRRFPAAAFVVTGVLGPQANAHGPNEFLHIPTGKRVTACVAGILARHAVAHRGAP